MLCHKCGNLMEPGAAEVRGTLLGFLTVGYSHQNLFFEPRDTSPPNRGAPFVKKRITVLPPHERASAHRCTNCRITVIER